MISFKKLEMKKVNMFSSEEEVERVISSLEEKTAQSLIAFAKSKQKVQGMAHLKYLD
jgi:hypothetical protein